MTDALRLHLTPSQVADVLPGFLTAGIPVMLWGPPGCSKSALVHQAAATLKRAVRDVRMVLLDPVDLRGLPSFIGENGNRRTVWSPPNFLPLEPDSTDVLFLDELPQAPTLTQNAGLGLVHDRRVGEAVLGPNVAIVAAGNRVQDRAGAGRMTTALANRFPIHIDVEPSADDWLAYVLVNEIAPGVMCRMDVRQWIAHQPTKLMQFHPERNPRSFPSPRSYVGLSRVLDALPGGIGHPAALSLVAGCIGEETAPMFVGFSKIVADLPLAKDVLSDPEGSAIPSDPAVLYALTGSLVDHARTCDRKALQALVTYGQRWPEKEMCVSLFRDAVAVREADLLALPAMTKWLNSNVNLLTGHSA